MVNIIPMECLLSYPPCAGLSSYDTLDVNLQNPIRTSVESRLYQIIILHILKDAVPSPLSRCQLNLQEHYNVMTSLLRRSALTFSRRLPSNAIPPTTSHSVATAKTKLCRANFTTTSSCREAEGRPVIQMLLSLGKARNLLEVCSDLSPQMKEKGAKGGKLGRLGERKG